MAKKWIVWVALAAVIGIAIWKRCEIPYLRDYLCKGGEASPVEMPGNAADMQNAILSPVSQDPAAMAQAQQRMTPLGPAGGRDPVSGAFLPNPNANLARIKVS